MQNQYQTVILRSHSERQVPNRRTTAATCTESRSRWFDFQWFGLQRFGGQRFGQWFAPRRAIARAALMALSTWLFLTGATPALSEPTLTFDPPPGTRLSNFDAYLTVTFELDGDSWDTLPWDWQNPRVRLNGTDISLPVRSLISGATASVLTPDEIVVSQQTMTGDRMVLALSGLRLDDGFNRLIVELVPTQEGIEPLKFDVSYPVIAGQDQATQ